MSSIFLRSLEGEAVDPAGGTRTALPSLPAPEREQVNVRHVDTFTGKPPIEAGLAPLLQGLRGFGGAAQDLITDIATGVAEDTAQDNLDEAVRQANSGKTWQDVQDDPMNAGENDFLMRDAHEAWGRDAGQDVISGPVMEALRNTDPTKGPVLTNETDPALISLALGSVIDAEHPTGSDSVGRGYNAIVRERLGEIVATHAEEARIRKTKFVHDTASAESGRIGRRVATGDYKDIDEGIAEWDSQIGALEFGGMDSEDALRIVISGMGEQMLQDVNNGVVTGNYHTTFEGLRAAVRDSDDEGNIVFNPAAMRLVDQYENRVLQADADFKESRDSRTILQLESVYLHSTNPADKLGAYNELVGQVGSKLANQQREAWDETGHLMSMLPETESRMDVKIAQGLIINEKQWRQELQAEGVPPERIHHINSETRSRQLNEIDQIRSRMDIMRTDDADRGFTQINELRKAYARKTGMSPEEFQALMAVSKDPKKQTESLMAAFSANDKHLTAAIQFLRMEQVYRAELLKPLTADPTTGLTRDPGAVLDHDARRAHTERAFQTAVQHLQELRGLAGPDGQPVLDLPELSDVPSDVTHLNDLVMQPTIEHGANPRAKVLLVNAMTSQEARGYLESGIPLSPVTHAAAVLRARGYQVPAVGSYTPLWDPFMLPLMESEFSGAGLTMEDMMRAEAGTAGK